MFERPLRRTSPLAYARERAPPELSEASERRDRRREICAAGPVALSTVGPAFECILARGRRCVVRRCRARLLTASGSMTPRDASACARLKSASRGQSNSGSATCRWRIRRSRNPFHIQEGRRRASAVLILTTDRMRR